MAGLRAPHTFSLFALRCGVADMAGFAGVYYSFGRIADSAGFSQS
jgi:hypothetical protein